MNITPKSLIDFKEFARDVRRSEPGFPATRHWALQRVRLSLKERRMHLAEPNKFNRKSGEAEGSAVLRTPPGNVFRGSGLGFEARGADR
jgi:hypothetical protein